jgi:hypothetical protein
MVERVQVSLAASTGDPEKRTAADQPAPGQRAMAGLAVAYVVILSSMVESRFADAGIAATHVVYGLVLAVPLLLRRRPTFNFVCGVLAGLVIVAGVLPLAESRFVFWPAALPLTLATIQVPERWAWAVTPVALSIVTLLLGLFAYWLSLL